MVTKISLGKSLYGALAYNGEKINKEQGRLLATNRIFNDGSGTVDIAKAMEGFLAFMPATVRTEKPVLHISINPHPDDVLTDTELQEIAREYLDRLGYGNQPYMVYKHEDIDPTTCTSSPSTWTRAEGGSTRTSFSAGASAYARIWNGSMGFIQQNGEASA